MHKHFGSDDDDDGMDRRSPLLQTQRFTKSGTMGTKDFKLSTTPTKLKSNELSNLKIDLNRINDDSLNDSEDDANTKTGRSTSSATTSPLTPKPKERSFIRNPNEKPKIQPRHIDVDDDDRNVFGQTTMKPSPRHQILSLKEEKERDQSFMKDFQNTEKSRKSPTDLFSTDHKFDSRKSIKKSPTDNDNRQQQNFQKSRHSPIDSDQSQSQRNSHRNKDDTDDDDDDENLFNKQPKRHDYTKQKQSSHDLIQTSPKDTPSSPIHHQPLSSRPGSASRKESDSARRSSYGDEQDAIISSPTNPTTPSRPTSAKTNTTRQHTQSAIDNVSSANAPPTLNPLTANNEALAATLQPSSPPVPPPRPSAQLPPRPKSGFNTTTTIKTSGGINKKQKFPVPTRYREITSKVDHGRAPTSADLTKSVQLAVEKALKTQTLPRPQSSRSRKQSANSSSGDRQRRRSSSAYEHVKPRVNTNLSINFDELNTSQMRADSSQSIKDSVYLDWLKTKEDEKKRDKQELKQWQEENKKRVNKNQIEERLRQQAETLQRWRQEKDREIKDKRRQELELQREEMEKKRQHEQQKLKDAKLGFEEWKVKKDDHLQQKVEEDRNKKSEIEKRQEEKQKKVLEAEKAYDKWMTKKSKEIQKNEETKKNTQKQLKQIRQDEEMKFVNAQDAYEKWLKDKDKYELEDKLDKQRRNSLSAKQQQVPFLPGGSQKNTGKIRHVVW